MQSKLTVVASALRRSANLAVVRNFCAVPTWGRNQYKSTYTTQTRSFSVFNGKDLNKDLPNVVILGTGGTIAGKGASSTNTAVYQAGAMDVSDLVSGVPEVLSVANCVAKGVLQKPSEDMKVQDWIKLAEAAQNYLNEDDVDGIVVTHGTDTLEESSYFCHLVLRSKKPVVFTGAMRPATALSADGGLNLLNAVVAAGAEETRGLGSLVAMNEELYSARDVTKMNTFQVNSFGSGDCGPLGFVQEGNVFMYHAPYRKHSSCEFDLEAFKKFTPKVDILYVYPSLDLDVLNYYLDKNDGLIIAASGNGSISDDVLPILEKRKSKCVVVKGSRCPSGIVSPNPVGDKKLNLISSNNLTPQKARVLLMLALTVTKDVSKIQEIFNMYLRVCSNNNELLLYLHRFVHITDGLIECNA